MTVSGTERGVQQRLPFPAGLSVLVVEDDPDSAEALADLAVSWGHRPTVVADGETALAEIAALDPDVVLLDIGLPGISGWEVAERIERRGMPPRPLVLVLSAYPPDRDRANATGVLFYFRKPAGVHALRGVLEKFGRAIGALSGVSGP